MLKEMRGGARRRLAVFSILAWGRGRKQILLSPLLIYGIDTGYNNWRGHIGQSTSEVQSCCGNEHWPEEKGWGTKKRKKKKRAEKLQGELRQELFDRMLLGREKTGVIRGRSVG